MLSLNPISLDQAAAYYKVVAEQSLPQELSAQERYYNQQAGIWYGEGAKLLKLRGKSTDLKSFDNLLAGRSPRGRKQLIRSGVNAKHRSASDWTFSVPKSFSTTAELLAPPQLRDEMYRLHNLAVRRALNHFEKNYAQARITTKRNTQTIPTGNIVSALFLENSSRELDPQIHTHCVIMNMTKRPDGQWRALSNEELYFKKMFIGQVYRNELARGLQSIGFSVHQREKGLFEISGVPAELLKTFSTRADQIEKYMKENKLRELYPNVRESVLKAIASERSRQKKQVDVTQQDLKQHWDAKLEKAGYKGKEEELLKGMLNQPKLKAEKINHVDRAIQVLTEEESLVTREAILQTALRLSLGQKTIRDIEQDFGTAKLIREREGLYTTAEIERIEQEIKDTALKYRNVHQPLHVPADLDKSSLTKSQKQALVHGLTNTDAISGIQGDAGTGKTTMLKRLAQEYEKAGREVIALAPTTAAVEELKNNDFPQAQTIDRFLLADQAAGTGRLIVVDEASFLGSKKFYKLLQKTNPKQDKILLVFDNKQLVSIEAGAIVDALQRNNIIKTARMDQNVRQQNDTLYRAVNHLAKKEVEPALKILDENQKITEISDRDERLEVAANKFVQAPAKKRPLLIVQTNADRRQVNQLIRQKLIDQKQIDGKRSVTVTTQQPKNTLSDEKRLPLGYEVGDSFLLSENYNGLRAGTRGIIEKVDQQKKTIQCLVKSDGRTKRVKLDIGRHGHRLTAYRQEERDLARGEQIVFLKADKRLGVSNGTTGTVLNLRGGNVQVLTNQKRIIEFNVEQYSHFDYAYATTNFKAQGRTTDRVVYLADTHGRVNFNNFYVAASRARHDIEILTDNKEQLRSLAAVEQVKTSTLDLAPAQTAVSRQRQPQTQELERSLTLGL